MKIFSTSDRTHAITPSDLLLWVACWAISFCSALLLYKDWNRVQGYWDSEMIEFGTFQLVTGKILTKSSSSLMWYQSLAGQSAYLGDTLKAGENSSATILLKNGTQILIPSASSLQLATLDPLKLTPTEGRMLIRKNQSTHIVSNLNGHPELIEYPMALESPSQEGIYWINPNENVAKIPFRIRGQYRSSIL